MSRRTTKAENYIHLLDEARSDGNWDAVPELVRKVRKHAPERACLTLTAETEHVIAKATQNAPLPARPSSEPAELDAAVSQDQLSKLTLAINQEQGFLEDKFQAQVCAGWLRWALGEYSPALARLPNSIDQEYAQFESLSNITEWTKICVVKSAYLRSNCLVRAGQPAAALESCSLSLPPLSTIWSSRSAKYQLRYWSELYLTEYCVLQGQSLQDDTAAFQDPNCLAAFRWWARFWDAQGPLVAGGCAYRGSVPRRRLWLEYYGVLSELIKRDLPYPTGYAPISAEASPKGQLRLELKQVEAKYEALLVSETQFPRADEQRDEVEAFVELVMANWTVLSGRGWREHGLGNDGKDSLSRGVLDLLYRAAAKTFHSTAIARQLFRVHLAVAEFDLAFKSLDAYLDLVERGKARAEKTGHPEPGLDDDATAMETMAAAITALCRYGSKDRIEKARALAAELEHWLEDWTAPVSEQEDGASPVSGGGHSAPAHTRPGPRTLAQSWQAVGLAQAQWARETFDASSRAELQAKAVRCLRRSLSPEFGRIADVPGVYALGVLLAEQRELTPAIELVRTALLAEKATSREQELRNGPYWRERSLLPLWHLLALLLSARQDHLMASRACEGAFEQFRDPSVLFGDRRLNGTYRSDHLNEAEARNETQDGSPSGVVDDMDDYEKEAILEVKLTQLALVELLEGPKVAVNASLELLTLFSRLFGVPSPEVASRAAPKTADIPKSSAGTIRGIKGSIFGSRSERSGRRRQSNLNSERLSTVHSRPQTMQTSESVPGSMTQTTDESVTSRESQLTRKSASVRKPGEPGRRTSLRKRDRSVSRKRAVSSGGAPHSPTTVDGESFYTPLGDPTPLGSDFLSIFAAKRFSAGGRTASQTGSNGSNEGAALGTADGERILVDRLEAHPALLPVIQFPQDHEQRRRNAVLIKVWLMIAGFYRRAGMLEDAQAATGEAAKLVRALESDVLRDSVGTLPLRKPGWAETKSVEELWADVFSENGRLSLAGGAPYAAKADFESALTHYPDHPSAIVGLSEILLDIYTEALVPPPAVPSLGVATSAALTPTPEPVVPTRTDKAPELPPSVPLGLWPTTARRDTARAAGGGHDKETDGQRDGALPPPYKATSRPLTDRLTARDRAYGLLSGLTKSGAGWNYSEAWLALARAYEESGQVDKAKEALWWCVELEEGMGARPWDCVGPGGYVP